MRGTLCHGTHNTISCNNERHACGHVHTRPVRVQVVEDGIGLSKSSIINKMGVKLLYYRIWIRGVLWLGPGAPKVLGSNSKNTSRIQMLRHFDL